MVSLVTIHPLDFDFPSACRPPVSSCTKNYLDLLGKGSKDETNVKQDGGGQTRQVVNTDLRAYITVIEFYRK